MSIYLVQNQRSLKKDVSGNYVYVSKYSLIRHIRFLKHISIFIK